MNKTNHPITPLAQRFAVKCAEPDKRGCVLWLGSRLPFGYGRISAGGKGGRLLIASRVAWELVHGPVPIGQCVLHRCDTPACVNVEHLYLGSHYDNVMDSVKRKRRALKLTPAKVRAIRKMLTAGVMQHEIATQFGICRPLVSSIKSGRRWKHV